MDYGVIQLLEEYLGRMVPDVMMNDDGVIVSSLLLHILTNKMKMMHFILETIFVIINDSPIVPKCVESVSSPPPFSYFHRGGQW